MQLRNYEDFVEDCCKPYVDFNYCVVALNGEAGEVAEWHKKANLRNNEKFTDVMLLDELGDVLFYLTRTASIKGWSIFDVMDANVRKLTHRLAETGVVVG